MLSKELENTLNSAYKDVKEKGYKCITTEHLLLALLDNPSAIKLLESCSADLGLLRRGLLDYLDKHIPLLDDADNQQAETTTEFNRVLQRSVFHVQSAGGQKVIGANVLLAIFGERDSHAVHLMNTQNINRRDVVNKFRSATESN